MSIERRRPSHERVRANQNCWWGAGGGEREILGAGGTDGKERDSSEIIKGNEAELPSILLHSAKAVPGVSATGSSLASLPCTPVGLWSYSVPPAL